MASIEVSLSEIALCDVASLEDGGGDGCIKHKCIILLSVISSIIF